jgi:hypothetical protein
VLGQLRHCVAMVFLAMSAPSGTGRPPGAPARSREFQMVLDGPPLAISGPRNQTQDICSPRDNLSTRITEEKQQ